MQNVVPAYLRYSQPIRSTEALCCDVTCTNHHQYSDERSLDIRMACAKSDDYIAAIDFGTSNCSLAYSVDRETVNTVCLCEAFDRVPTAILIEPEDKTSHGSGNYSMPMTVIDIGKVAQQSYGNLPKEEYIMHLYFECFKMKLRPHEDVS